MNESYFGYRTLLLVFIIGLNAFFAASEVALVSVRLSRLRQLADEGQVGAQAALTLLSNTERLLSVVQVGVTLASLGLGWVGEETVYRFLVSLFEPVLTPAGETLLHGVSFVTAFSLMTFLHVVIGEVVPKNLAIEKADRLAVLVAPVLLVFYRLAEPFVYVIERSSRFLSRLIGLSGEQRGGGHSAEELKFIISTSRTEGHLMASEEDAIHHLLDLQNYAVREIMVPRNDVLSLPVDASLDEVLRVMTEQLYSRVPVYEDRPENIIGVLHYKDLIRVWEERRVSTGKRRPVRAFDLRRLIRKPLIVPETKQVNQLIDEFRREHHHMALVVDEFGTIVGLVTLEDVMEQIFGEIEDEYDIRRPLPPVEAPIVDVEGTINIRDLENQYGIELPGEAGFETLAGFLLFRLGHIPSVGEMVEHDGRSFSILEMDRNRISKVRIEKLGSNGASDE